ncbi:MAG TPA: Spy/CpxP family protein refolding chaperone [Pyrinomonadaceae bacterium]|jgi:Spy/CpxP family protein refolding chaperone
MSLRGKLIGTSLALGLMLGFGTAALAQQPAPQGAQQPGPGMGRHGGRGGPHRRGGMHRIMRELNLTEAQQQQARAIAERYESSNRVRHEELRRLHEQGRDGALSPEAQARLEALRKEVRESMKQMHAEMLTILTPEQRARLEQLEAEHKARRQERRGRPDNQQDNDQ